MVQKQFSFDEFGFSSKLIRDLVAENQAVFPLINQPFSMNGLAIQAEGKVFSDEKRRILVDRLKVQNERIPLSESSQKNIELLSNSNSFTITTGHQLNLLTGPLYSIYKVAQIIALCREANAKDPSRNYIPVFWMATEDHDFEEINHLHLFGKKISWEKDGQNNAVAGRIKPAGIQSFIDELIGFFRNEGEIEKLNEIAQFYTKADNLAEATRGLMNYLFSAYGLVIIDGDDRELKQLFSSIIEEEITKNFVHTAVAKTNQELEERGYHQQVFLRHCNLFTIAEDGTRRRLGIENGQYFEGEHPVRSEDLLERLKKNPQAFSPNALMRPVYQELILPNLAYVGGGGEIAYWMQLKGVFDALNLAFPMLRVRDSIVLLRKRELDDLAQLGFGLIGLKRDLHEIVREMALEDVEIELELNEERARLIAIKEDLLIKANEVGQGMAGLIEAEFSKMDKGLERIESKLIKAEKTKHEQKANKIGKLQAKIYPEKGFQERYENFLPYYLIDSDFVEKIVNHLQPSDKPTISILEL